MAQTSCFEGRTALRARLSSIICLPATHLRRPSSAVWHDVECGSYSADLALWEELATHAGGPILELGCGTGRVALQLGRCGHRVTGLDRDAVLLAAFGERAAGLPVEAELGDAAGFELGGEFGLALAPMQLVQLLGGAEERLDCLRCVAAHLRAGGRAALAIVEQLPLARGGRRSPARCPRGRRVGLFEPADRGQGELRLDPRPAPATDRLAGRGSERRGQMRSGCGASPPRRWSARGSRRA